MISQGYNNFQNYQAFKVYNKINYRQPQVDNIPGPNFEYLDPCLLDVSKSVCKLRIDTNKGSFGGSGFFLKFLINGKFYFWLVSNEHVIKKEMIINKNTIKVSFNIENKAINIKLEQSERYIKTFKDYNIDATVIQIISKDNVYIDYFLEPELGYDNNSLVGKEIFIPQFPSFQQLTNARGIIKEISHINSNEFTHLAKTQKGSSGSPIFLKGNKRVIGIHKEGNLILQENYGDFIASIISILTTDIMFRLNIMQNNYNGFLNSPHDFGLVNPNPNNNIFIGPAYPINQINPVSQINKNMKNNNIALPGNLNKFNAINGNNNISYNMNNNNLNVIGNLNKSNLNNPDTNFNNSITYRDETQGEMNSEIGEKYIGQLINGLRHGKGTVYYKKNEKIKYEGDFVNGKYEGFGELYNENGKIIYKGYFKNNKYEGNGKLYDYFDYIGPFVNGLKQGKGIEYHKNGNIHYEGYFKNDKYEGNVKLYFDNGNIEYEGPFVNGLKHGKGKQYYDNGNIKYEGYFKNGKYEGKGYYEYANGKIYYEGDFKNGLKHGKGKK